MQMSAFSHQNHVPFAIDFPSLPTISPFDLPPPSTRLPAGDVASTSTFFPCYYNPFDASNVIPAEVTAPVNAGVSTITSNATTTPTPESSSSLDSARAVPLRYNKTSSPSSSVQPSDAACKTQCSVDKKRKERRRCSSGSTRSKDAKEAVSKKLKKSSAASKEAKEKKAQEEPPTGYIHVRARRGQATDSHSLAERVRRERIREKMKMLQGLVPGCEKVVGKALLLDEIINYVQSLQNQVEFLSMKLAYMNPMPFGLDFDDQMTLPEGGRHINCYERRYHDADGFDGIKLQKPENMSPALSDVQRTSHVQPTAFADTTNNYTVQDTSVPFLLQGKGPSCSLYQDSGSNFVPPVGDHRQCFLDQVEFSNVSSFQ